MCNPRNTSNTVDLVLFKEILTALEENTRAVTQLAANFASADAKLDKICQDLDKLKKGIKDLKLSYDSYNSFMKAGLVVAGALLIILGNFINVY